MDEKTLTALKGSIAKWEGIINGTVKDKGSRNCPLCRLFNPSDCYYEKRCVECPIYQKTGEKFCENSPYEDYLDIYNNEEREKVAAEKFLAFLKSLLPEGENNDACM